MSLCSLSVFSELGKRSGAGRRFTAATTVLLIGLSSVTVAQQRRQPTFRTGTEVIEVDVTVLNGRGEPIDDLRSPEFTVTIDGEPRRVVSADFIDLREAQPEARPTVYSGGASYSSNLEATRGRLIVIVVDREHVSFGAGSNVTRAAARFLDKLTRNDRVALVTVPQPGSLVDFTADHDVVRQAIDGLVGLGQSPPGMLNIAVHEAFTLVNAGLGSLAAVRLMERLCGQYQQGDLERDACENRVETEARLMVEEQRMYTNVSLRALESILDALRAIEGPKHLVWISEGLPIEGAGAAVRPIEQIAAAARTTIHVLVVDQALADVSIEELPPAPLEDRRREEHGLSVLASMTRGDLRRIGPNADAAFERLEMELSGYYLLGIESLPSDQDGDAHEINVSVLRASARVRSRREFLIPVPDEKVTGEAEAQMLRVLHAPFVSTGLPLRVATYAFQAEETGQVRVLVAAEVDALGPTSSEVAIGYSLRDLGGNIVARGQQQVTPTPIERPQEAVFEHVLTFVTDPGSYVLKLAVADGAGRYGSVEHPVQAWQLAGLAFASGDLLLTDADAPSANGLVAPVEARLSSDRLAVYTELYSDAQATLDAVQVRIDVTDLESGEPHVSGMAFVEPGNHSNSRIVSSAVPVDPLPPGRYVARAVVTRDGERLAQLSRPFRVTRPLAAGVVASPGPAAAAPDAIMPAAVSQNVVRSLLGDTLAFNSADVLAEDIVSFFMDRLDEDRPVVKRVTSDVRAGQLTGAGRRAFEIGDQAVAAFLHGLDLFAQGKGNEATTQFSAALIMDREFIPAFFYLGACYAVGDRDDEALTAWRRTLLVPGMGPVTSSFLADTLFRTGETREALAVLRDALAARPGDDRLVRRVAIGHALELEYAQALAIIEPYIERHPGDPAALLLALLSMFSGHVDGSAPVDAQALERMRGYADDYRTAQGPHLVLVLDWVRFVSGS